MKYILNKYHFKIPDNVLLEDLRKSAKKLGKKSISAGQYDLVGRYNSKTVRTRFAAWNNALKKAGLEIQKRGRVSKKELLSNLKQVWDSIKRQPLVKDMKRPRSAFSYSLYAKKFGSWRKALEVFVSSRQGNHYPALTKTSNARPKKHRKTQLYVTKSMRYDILKRDNFRCRLCGLSPAIKAGVTLHIDHIIPRVKGGESVPGNLQTLCSDCNYGKGAKTPLNPPEGGK